MQIGKLYYHTVLIAYDYKRPYTNRPVRCGDVVFIYAVAIHGQTLICVNKKTVHANNYERK